MKRLVAYLIIVAIIAATSVIALAPDVADARTTISVVTIPHWACASGYFVFVTVYVDGKVDHTHKGCLV
jgi:hypothetical protein